MCLAIPGEIIKIEGRKVWVKYPGITNIAMMSDEEVKVGDMVMVQMGIVVRKLNKKQAEEMVKAWKGAEKK